MHSSCYSCQGDTFTLIANLEKKKFSKVATEDMHT